MNQFKLCMCLLVCSIIFSCKDDDEPDTTAAFVGTYKIDEIEFKVSQGNDSEEADIDVNWEIEFSKAQGLKNDELEADVQEVADELFAQFLVLLENSYNTKVDFLEDPIAEVTGDEIEIDADVNLVISDAGGSESYETDFELLGELDGNEIEVHINMFFLDFKIEVEAVAEKQ